MTLRRRSGAPGAEVQAGAAGRRAMLGVGERKQEGMRGLGFGVGSNNSVVLHGSQTLMNVGRWEAQIFRKVNRNSGFSSQLNGPTPG